MRSLKPDKKFSQDLSAAELDVTIEIDNDYKLDQIYFKFTAAISETVTISIVSTLDGATYTQVLQDCTLVSETAFTWRPQGEANFKKTDNIRIQCTNVGGAETVTGKVRTSEVGA